MKDTEAKRDKTRSGCFSEFNGTHTMFVKRKYAILILIEARIDTNKLIIIL